jgi:hypothetical protein
MSATDKSEGGGEANGGQGAAWAGPTLALALRETTASAFDQAARKTCRALRDAFGLGELDLVASAQSAAAADGDEAVAGRKKNGAKTMAAPSEWRLKPANRVAALPRVVEAHRDEEAAQEPPTLGAEIEVQWSAYFPELWERFGLSERRVADLPPGELEELTAACAKIEATLRPRLEKSVECGVPRGNDRYWEFALRPVGDAALLAEQIALLTAAGLLPREGRRSLQITVAGIRQGEDAMWMAIALSAFAGDGRRWAEGLALHEKGGLRAGWSRKGKGGVLEKSPEELAGGAPFACEFRPLLLPAGDAELLETLRAAQSMGEGIRQLQKEWPKGTANGASVGRGGLLGGEHSKRWTLFRLWAEAIVAAAIGREKRAMLALWEKTPESWAAWKELAEAHDSVAPALREAWRAFSEPDQERERILGEQEARWLGAAARLLAAERGGIELREGVARWPSLAEAESMEVCGSRRSSLLVEVLARLDSVDDEDIAEALLERSPLEAADERGATALMLAAQRGMTKAAVWIAQRADARRVDHHGADAFARVCMKGQRETAEALWPWADLSRRAPNGMDVLEFAICSNSVPLVQWLAARWPAEDWRARRGALGHAAMEHGAACAAEWIGGELNDGELLRWVRQLANKGMWPPEGLVGRIEAARQSMSLKGIVDREAAKQRKAGAAARPSAEEACAAEPGGPEPERVVETGRRGAGVLDAKGRPQAARGVGKRL